MRGLLVLECWVILALVINVILFIRYGWSFSFPFGGIFSAAVRSLVRLLVLSFSNRYCLTCSSSGIKYDRMLAFAGIYNSYKFIL